jgi:conjugative transposon TraM protein
MKSEVVGHSAKLVKQRKFLMVLPVLVFPFVTLMLWSLGVLGSPKEEPKKVAQKGFNMNLPDARPAKDNDWNKLKFYEQADRDSAKYKSLLKNDPYFQLSPVTDRQSFDTGSLSVDVTSNNSKLSYDPYPSDLVQKPDPNEEKVYKKLAELNRELNKTSGSEKSDKEERVASVSKGKTGNEEEIERLESMMQQMNGADDSDPQLLQINNMLEKIMDIQHPERVKDRIKSQSEVNKSQVFPVSVNNDQVVISLLESRERNNSRFANDTAGSPIVNRGSNGFYSLDELSGVDELQTAIKATIPETQILVSGATVKLRLTDDVYIQGVFIPKDLYVFGTALLNGERLTIDISTIRYKNNILPVALSVYDLDGMEGIYMPGAITRDVAKQSTDQAIQSLSIASLDPSLGAQAASAGIQAAKSLIGKKTKLIKVTVRSGYEVLLRDNNKRQ